jgi:predicted nuclease of predicted toxin-antitoxin system
MLPLIADEDFNGRIVRGIRRRVATLDLVRVQNIGRMGADDAELLEWAAREGRVLVTHDANTMTRHAYARVAAGEPMAGVIVAAQALPIGAIIEDLVMIVECTETDDWHGQVIFLPL